LFAASQTGVTYRLRKREAAQHTLHDRRADERLGHWHTQAIPCHAHRRDRTLLAVRERSSREPSHSFTIINEGNTAYVYCDEKRSRLAGYQWLALHRDARKGVEHLGGGGGEVARTSWSSTSRFVNSARDPML